MLSSIAPISPSPRLPVSPSSLLSVLNLLTQHLYKIFARVEAGLLEGDFAFAVEDDGGWDRRDCEMVVQVIGVGDRKVEFVLLQKRRDQIAVIVRGDRQEEDVLVVFIFRDGLFKHRH